MTASITSSAAAGRPICTAPPSHAGRAGRREESAASAMRASEGGLQDTSRLDVVAVELHLRPTLAEDVEPVAVAQLFEFGRVPDEAAPVLGLASDQLVDLMLGADI